MRSSHSTRVWASLLTNENYLSGLLTLDFSLKKHGSRYPLVALYTDQLPFNSLAALFARGIPTQRVETLHPEGSKDYRDSPRFMDCWTKLSAFKLSQYERIVLLDSDMLVMSNMDELMDIEIDGPELEGKGNRVLAACHACVCNPLQLSHYPDDWKKENCALTTQHSTPDPAQTVAPPCDASPLGFLNGGLLVICPSKALFKLIVDVLESDAVNHMDFADQSLLSELFRKQWVPLPYIYNALKTIRWQGVHADIWRDERVKNVHYILTPKPWDDFYAQSKPSSKIKGKIVGEDPTHMWWFDANAERLAVERKSGAQDDGF